MCFWGSYTSDSRLSAVLAVPTTMVPLLSEDWRVFSSSCVPMRLSMALYRNWYCSCESTTGKQMLLLLSVVVFLNSNGVQFKALILKTNLTCFTVHATLRASRHVTCLHPPQWWPSGGFFGKKGIKGTRRHIAAVTLQQMCRLFHLKGGNWLWWTTTHHQQIVRQTTYDVAEDPWSHEVRQLGRLEDIDRTFGLQLASQRRQSAERSCCDSAHTGKNPQNNQSCPDFHRYLTRRSL